MGYIIECLQYILVDYKRNNNSNITILQDEGNDGNRHFDSESIIIFVYEWLSSITKCGRFSLNALFLSDDHKKALHFLFDEMIFKDKEQGYDISDGIMTGNDINLLKKEFSILLS